MALKLFAPMAFGSGTVGLRVFAKVEKRPDGMMLPGNGRPVTGSLMAVERREKSPFRSAGLGTLPSSGRSADVRKPSDPPKAKNLFLITGPPSVKPAWVLSPGFCPKKLAELKLSSRR